jgi:hypothetical protein
MIAPTPTPVPLSQPLEAGQRDTMEKARDTSRDSHGTPHETAWHGNVLNLRTVGHTAGHMRCMWCPKLVFSGTPLRDTTADNNVQRAGYAGVAATGDKP